MKISIEYFEDRVEQRYEDEGWNAIAWPNGHLFFEVVWGEPEFFTIYDICALVELAKENA